jgi:multiple sugar transport system ATP-binding protein
LTVAKLTLSKVSAGDALLLDLEIPDRQFFVITGPAGVGKSHVLRMIAGLEKISLGQISMGEKVINDLAPQERDVAMVFENDSLYPHMTMRENIAFGLKVRRFAKSEIGKRVEDAANALGIGQFLEKKPNECELVTRQRVAIARGVVRQPQLFLYDCPGANLEPSSRAELRNEIANLHQRLQTTTILATADYGEAMSMAERIALLNRDGVEGIGIPRELYQQPGTIAVARSLGDPPINLVRGELKLERGVLQFCEAQGGTIQINLPPLERFEILRAFIGKSIVLGVRPEEVAVVSLGETKEISLVGRFRAVADRVERFGPQTDIHFDTGAHTGTSRIGGLLDHGAAGRRIEFVVNLEKVCFFDPSEGKRVV